MNRVNELKKDLIVAKALGEYMYFSQVKLNVRVLHSVTGEVVNQIEIPITEWVTGNPQEECLRCAGCVLELKDMSDEVLVMNYQIFKNIFEGCEDVEI